MTSMAERILRADRKADAPNGAVLYRGPSEYDGSPIVVILTGLANASANGKTGDLAQTWILRADLEPHHALKLGADTAVCGSCTHRSIPSGGKGTCYVRVFQAPLGVYRAWKRGVYPDATSPEALREIGRGRNLRLGSYGDPAAVPLHVWESLTSESLAHWGYTHGWRNAPGLRSLCMASVDSASERDEAQAQGWRTFRVSAFGDDTRARGEARCPASAEAGKRVTCEACPLRCGGASVNRPSIVIQAHGSARKRVA